MRLKLVFAELRSANVRRCEEVFHALGAWTSQRWALACAGEVGEVCNAWKKVVRGDGTIMAVGQELADVVIYADLLAARLGAATAAVEEWDGLGVEVGGGLDGVEEDILELVHDMDIIAARIRAFEPVVSLHSVVRSAAIVAAGVGLDLPFAIVQKFNAVSKKRNCRILLGMQPAEGAP